MSELRKNVSELTAAAGQLQQLVEQIAGEVAILRAKTGGDDVLDSDVRARAAAEAPLEEVCRKLEWTLQLLELAKRELS